MSVTDMTAPVVGSSGGVYALVSAHLANVVMVSLLGVHLTVCVFLSVMNRSLSSFHRSTSPHEQSRLLRQQTGAGLSTDSIHSCSSPSARPEDSAC